MPRFYLHVYDSGGGSCDEEGLELPDLEAARASAIAGIRSLASEEVRAGRLDLEGHVEIADKSGSVLATVRFSEAVELRLPEDQR